MEMAMGAIMKTRNSVKIRRCLITAGFILSLLISVTASSQGREVFRWVDENGVVHFTHNPPKSAEYDKYKPNIGKVGTVAPPEPQPAIDVAPKQQQAQTSTPDPAVEPPELTAEELAIACGRARENVALLEPVTNVIVPDETNGTRRLDDAERLDWLDKSRSFLATNCN